jgi:hypothetical protein
MQNFIFGPALFYDIPEYLSIVTTHSFWQVFTLGHFPIHPVFLSILWIFIKFLPVNAVAMIFGIFSLFLVHKISKLLFKKDSYWLPVLMFILFPGVWLISTNLMVESMTLTFFILSTYLFLFKKHHWFFVSLFLMIGTHLQSIVWIPAIFAMPFIFNKEIKFNKSEIYSFIKLSVISVGVSILFYSVLYWILGERPGGTTEQLFTYFSSGPARMARNVWISFIRDFGTLTPLVLLFLLFKYVKSKKELLGWAIFFGLVFLTGANWQGDFMPRRLIFVGLILSLGLYKFLRLKSIFMVLYLIPIVLANVILYSKGSPFQTFNLPANQVLIQTHYLKPFTDYSGTVLWIGESDLGGIDDHLKSGKKVFLAREAVTAPYQLLVGNNYHVTSLGKVGDSESRFLFMKYKVRPYSDNYELTFADKSEISEDAGEPVIFYDYGFWGRLARRRIDYGDIGTWIWALTANHRDPAGWIYKDVTVFNFDLWAI